MASLWKWQGLLVSGWENRPSWIVCEHLSKAPQCSAQSRQHLCSPHGWLLHCNLAERTRQEQVCLQGCSQHGHKPMTITRRPVWKKSGNIHVMVFSTKTVMRAGWTLEPLPWKEPHAPWVEQEVTSSSQTYCLPPTCPYPPPPKTKLTNMSTAVTGLPEAATFWGLCFLYILVYCLVFYV